MVYSLSSGVSANECVSSECSVKEPEILHVPETSLENHEIRVRKHFLKNFRFILIKFPTTTKHVQYRLPDINFSIH